LKVKTEPTIYSIPSKQKSLESFSGVGTDTVGPCNYDPKFEKIRRKMRTANLGASKTNRDPFSVAGKDETPAPGEYYDDTKTTKLVARSSYVFLSKVPKS